MSILIAGWPFPPRPHTMATIVMHYCVMLGLCAARHIPDPHEQVSTFEPLGARPVTDRDTFPERGLRRRTSPEVRAGLFHFIS